MYARMCNKTFACIHSEKFEWVSHPRTCERCMFCFIHTGSQILTAINEKNTQTRIMLTKHNTESGPTWSVFKYYTWSVFKYYNYVPVVVTCQSVCQISAWPALPQADADVPIHWVMNKQFPVSGIFVWACVRMHDNYMIVKMYRWTCVYFQNNTL